MGKVTVETTPIRLTLQKGYQESIARREVALMEKQALASVSASGGSLWRKKDGLKVTLHLTGKLWATVDYREVEAACLVEFRKGYAPFVFDKYDALGLSPQYQKQLENEVASLIEEGAILTEEE